MLIFQPCLGFQKDKFFLPFIKKLVPGAPIDLEGDVAISGILKKPYGGEEFFVISPAGIFPAFQKKDRKPWIFHLPSFRVIGFIQEGQKSVKAVEGKNKAAKLAFIIGGDNGGIGADPCVFAFF